MLKLSRLTPLSMRRRQSWWPFKNSIGAEIPEYLDGTLAGDSGFDPLRLAKNKKILFKLREAEYRHARLAMLAVVGWPASELWHYQMMENESPDSYDFSPPSVLNGGLENQMVLIGLGFIFAVGAILEYEMMKKREREEELANTYKNFFDMWREDGWDVPGNYGFDPLKLGNFLSGNDNDMKLLIQTVEIFNGRVAMLAIVGLAVQEFVTGTRFQVIFFFFFDTVDIEKPVIYETPQFFEPISKYLT